MKKQLVEAILNSNSGNMLADHASVASKTTFLDDLPEGVLRGILRRCTDVPTKYDHLPRK